MKNTKQPQPWELVEKSLQATDLSSMERLFLAVGFYTGFRISDLLMLKWDDLDKDKWETTEQKTGKDRIVYWNESVKRLAGEVGRRSEWVFVAERGPKAGQRLTVHGAIYRVKKIFAKLGIEKKSVATHTFRKTFARRVYKQHGLAEAMDLLGHSRVGHTMDYLGLTEEKRKNIFLNL